MEENTSRIWPIPNHWTKSDLLTSRFRIDLIKIAREHISDDDASHDFAHAMRVLKNAEMIANVEWGDIDIITPSALFHDVKVYPKNHPNRLKSQEESAEIAEIVLNNVEWYPKEKIDKVKTCILECSFSKWIIPDSLESKILQDSDWLEATWAISIMRTYSSTWQMMRPFYNYEDPFCEKRQPDASKYALDLFYERLLKVEWRMHTKTAKEIAKRRTEFLHVFLNEFKLEIEGK